ncbi:MAG: ABC transporter permease [Planctomycetota bacterium]|jgi:peptide/nickel transport system permease protein|nr:ABC transporter permease [Planctomycetota bacterium]
MPDDEAGPIAMNRPPGAPGSRLWKKFLRTRGGKAGLIMIVLFLLIALFAPFLAHRLPFYWRDAASGEVLFPLLREFFAPSDTTEPFLEAGINFLLLFIPLSFAAWHFMKRFAPSLMLRESKSVALLFGVLFSGAVWFGLGGMIVQAGGSDWLTGEARPTPDVDAVEHPGAFLSPPPAGDDLQLDIRGIVGERIGQAMRALGEKAGARVVKTEEILALAVQRAIDGPPMAGVGAITAKGRIDARGITDANLGAGMNAVRWNRILVERAYPELLSPFVRFRTAFLIAAFCCLLALIGLTYVFMAGANQFSLPPAWLALCALAVALLLPFTGRSRNDPTPYRQLAAEGKGYGIFPPIPYGPNEQGFGPRLPPDWLAASPSLSAADIASPERLRRLLDGADNPAARHIRGLLPAGGGKGGNGLPENAEGLAGILNQAIESDKFYDEEAFSDIRADIFLVPYLSAVRAGERLSALDALRMNRLLLERALPSTIESAAAGRWKKPRHLPGRHFFGTDESGRDVLVRVIHGARVSLSVGFISVALATIIGLVVGSLAAYYGGWADLAISRFMELMMCFPSFFLILAVIAVLDRRSILNIMLIIGLTSWTGVARLIRGEMLKHKKMDYVFAAVALGASDARIIFRHILPNTMAPVLVSISFGVTGAILTEASLSFIGFGVTPPTPTWGQLLSETRESPLANWWLAVFPGIVLFLSVFAYNLVGEALRDALDPRTAP